MRLNDIDSPVLDIITKKKEIEEVFSSTKENEGFRLRDMLNRRVTLKETVLLEASPSGRALTTAARQHGWIQYIEDGRPRYLKIVKLKSYQPLRWVIQGYNEQLNYGQYYYDLVPGRQYSDVFKQAAPLGFGEIRKLVLKRAITDHGKPLQTLADLKKVADDPGIELIERYEDAGVLDEGLPIEQVEEVLLNPKGRELPRMESSVQRRSLWPKR